MSLLDDPDVDPGFDPGFDEFALLSGGARDALFMDTEREIRRLQALQIGRIRLTEVSGGFGDDGFHSSRSWLQAVTNGSRGAAAARVDTARMLADMVHLARAASRGDIGDDQLRLLRQLRADDRCRHLLPDSDELLTGYAQTLSLADFRLVCQRWKAWADPDGAEKDHELSHQNRKVRFSKTDAGFVLQAEGAAHIGEELQQILIAHEQAEYLTDVAERLATYADQADKFPLARSGAQRRFDAFVAVFRKGAGVDQAGNIATTVNLITTPEHLIDVIGRFFDANDAGSAANHDRIRDSPSSSLCSQRICETANGAPVSDRCLLNAALTQQVRRVLLDSAGRVTELGRRARLFTGAAREAVLLYGDRCNWPGCERSVAGMHIDHLEAFARSGRTDPVNGAVTCPAHNLAKERHRVTVKRDETGWHHYRPDGSEIAPRPR